MAWAEGTRSSLTMVARRLAPYLPASHAKPEQQCAAEHSQGAQQIEPTKLCPCRIGFPEHPMVLFCLFDKVRHRHRSVLVVCSRSLIVRPVKTEVSHSFIIVFR